MRSRSVPALLALVVAVLAMPSPALAGSAGALDPTFHADGRVTTSFTRRFDGATDLVVLSDGRIAAVGIAGGRFGVVRYDTDGSRDTTFGGDGKVRTDFGPGADLALAAAQQADGKLVVAGIAGLEDTSGRVAVARYNDDGTLDTSFGGGDGKVTFSFGPGADGATGVLVDASNRIVVAGLSGVNLANPRFGLARLDEDGTLDTNFSGDGRVRTDFTPGFDGAFDLDLQTSDGTIVAAGISGGGLESPGNSRFALARYEDDGTLDTSFGGDGRVTTNLTPDFDLANGVEIQESDGLIVAAGTRAGNRFAVVRYETDGDRDAAFGGGDGIVTTDFGRRFETANDLVIQPDGAIVVAGEAASRFALARYLPTGARDPSFSGDGRVRTNFTPGVDQAMGVALDPTSGAIVAAGVADDRFAVARYVG